MKSKASKGEPSSSPRTEGGVLDSCSEWMLEEVATISKGNHRLWLRDPDRLLTAPAEEIQKTLDGDQTVFLTRHSLGLRLNLLQGYPQRWLLVDQTSDREGQSTLFAPDLRRLMGETLPIVKTVRDFLVNRTKDPSWPQDVESFPYRELARAHPVDFLRAYEDFRTKKQTGFSSSDLLLIGASAVLQRNLFALENAFHIIELAFHSTEKWKHLEDYFGAEEIQSIREHLRKLPRPLGDLFNGQAQSARLACAALLILSRHFENPSQFLPHLSSSLTNWQDCEPLFVAISRPSWFDLEIQIFDTAVSQGFLNTMKSSLGLNTPEKAKEFSDSGCWSQKLRELVLLEAPSLKLERPVPQAASHQNDLEQLVPAFRTRLAEVSKLLNIARATCDRLRTRLPTQLKGADFVTAFSDQGLFRLPILSAELNDYRQKISRFSPKPPGFEERWKQFETEVDQAVSLVEDVLKDFDFILGRFLENQFSQVVPKQIVPTNQLIEKFVSEPKSKNPKRPMAIILLDGMRYDLWRLIVRPHLERRYRVQEQVCMALLPSETRISRVGFFSGLKPSAFFRQRLTGGELPACNQLLKRLIPGHPDIENWDVKCAQVPFAFRSADNATFGIVFDFTDAIGHASAWEIDLLAELVQVWLKQVDKVLSLLPADCDLWVTVDHGQVISGTIPIEIPSELLVGDGNGYRAAFLKDKLKGHHAAHVFHIPARDMGYEENGYWAFPKPGYSFRLQPKNGVTSKFKPTANMRHGGLSAFEIFVPMACLTSRSKQIKVKISPKIVGTFTVGVSTQLSLEISADSPVEGLIEVSGNVDGLQPALVTNLGTTPQPIFLPYTPTLAGAITIKLEPRWGYTPVPSSVEVTLQIAPSTGRPKDDLDDKLAKLFG
ncbi:MAG: PglZ domain-containing protein [Verrucomicrobiae bacterium]|nr:PglZ domain-containing protein [Verrucomicrobiae bacterium]